MSSKKVPRQSEKTRVCIVGAGSVGVYAAREALKQGWEPTVYETAPMVGGVWRSGLVLPSTSISRGQISA